eukprot:146219_1
MITHVLLIYYWLTLLNGVSIDKFFDFNKNSVDEKTVPRNDDGYVLVQLNHKIQYFNGTYDKLWVSTNGVISFNHGVSQYIPASFPLNDHLFLAAFWADVDTSCNECGKIFYRESTDSTELSTATQQVSRVYPNAARGFNAKVLFIATWDHVGYYNSKSDKTNTFQVVIVTDEERSFVVFNYLSPAGIQWTFGGASTGKHAQAGFNKGDGKTFASIDGSYSDDIINVWKTSNHGVPGRFIYKIDEIEIKPVEQPEPKTDPDWKEGTPSRIVCPDTFKVYNIIFNAAGQLIHDIANDGLISFVNDEALIERMKEEKGGKVCAVGPFKVGKTWLLKQLCGKDIPDDQVLKTRGVSVIFSDKDNIACIDTEGEHRVDEYRLSKARKATDKFHQEVALAVCDLVFIVIDGLNAYKREYVDSMLKRVAALSSALAGKEVFVVHNFKDFDDKKVVYAYIRDTILLAYKTEKVSIKSGDGLNTWAYYTHYWSNDHNPEKHGNEGKLTVNHFVFAKEGTKAGDHWNKESMKRLTSLVQNVVFKGTELDITKQVTNAFSRILPSYYLAVEKCDNDQCQADTAETSTNSTDEVEHQPPIFDLLDPASWMNWFVWRTTKTASVYGHETEIKTNKQNEDESPYRADLIHDDNTDTFRLILKNKNQYDFYPFNLTHDGSPLDGYNLACQSAAGEKAFIIRCDVPGMKLISADGSLQSGEMQIKKSKIKRIGTITIKGIRAHHEDMMNTVFTNTDKAFSGPFRYDFQTPDDYDDDVIKDQQETYVTYENGELRIELPTI